ncbi:PREDICTED: heavy metal-associated isoprenylated plant protein 3-like [Ipomoea nil]|uniref:heavy metal-associated isoprenylated plant protein 3-like n=1 Tax=Ipomoea nil TaxID=35883 RepID=UPI000901C535|nr:PREDICTED: heavy metal-associated isoprenylated plant protein 3-like [Ipomoea nil]
MGGKKKNKSSGGGGEQENGGGGGDGSITVVLKADLHCEGCVSKIVKTIRSYDGVQTVDIDGNSDKVTVIGKVDPEKLRERVEAKTHKKIVLVSPQAKGGNGGEKQKKNGNDGEKKDKEKEPALTTVVLKMNLHCEGCIQKIQKTVSRTRGYLEMKVDPEKDLVTVTGKMNVKAMVEDLKKHLKKNVEIVPPKKEKGGKENAGGEKDGGGGGGKVVVVEGNRLQVQMGYPYNQDPYPYACQTGYQPFYNYPHAPQMFSDENPNACSVM